MIEDRLGEAVDRINERWRSAWDERCALDKAHKAALAAVKAEKAAPGSADDMENARAYWSMLHVIASQATAACQKAEDAVSKPKRPQAKQRHRRRA